MQLMRAAAREPLLHFLLLGRRDLRGLCARDRGNEASRPGEIVVTRRPDRIARHGLRSHLAAAADAAELDGLIRDYVRDEVLRAEALALGLDRDDTVIRRRLRQKLEFVSEDVAALAEPTDEQLRAYLTQHPGRVPHRTAGSPSARSISIRSGAARASRATPRAARAAGARRRRRRTSRRWATPRLLEDRFDALPAGEVVRQFGDEVRGQARRACRSGAGRARSSRGTACTWSSCASAPRAACRPLEEVRDAVRREWANARRQEANEKFYQTLLGRYTVTIERPADGAWAPTATAVAEARRMKAVVACACGPGPARAGARDARRCAHEVRPGYLELRQTGADTYDVLWKVPGRGDDLRLALYVELPEGSVNLSEPRGAVRRQAYTERWSVRRPGGLAGGTIRDRSASREP